MAQRVPFGTLCVPLSLCLCQYKLRVLDVSHESVFLCNPFNIAFYFVSLKQFYSGRFTILLVVKDCRVK